METDRGAGGHEHTLAPTFSGSTSAGIRALKIGVVVLGLTTAAQAVLFALSGSVALLGDTLHNGVDAAGTGVVWLAFRYAARVRTRSFSFGYHRFEDLAGLIVVVLIVASAGLALWESAYAFRHDIDVRRPWLVLVAGVGGFFANEAVAQYKIRTGRRIGSAALMADGQHSRVDGLTSLGVVAAAVGLMVGADWLDAAFGLLIGLVIAWAAYRAGREVILRLLDHADPLLHEQLERVARQMPGIEHVSDIRVRHMGRTVHVVANVCVPAERPLRAAHDAAEDLRCAWLDILPPGSAVDIHIDPYTPGIPLTHRGDSPHAH
jgi:cation diffusion facilitator family transporter